MNLWKTVPLSVSFLVLQGQAPPPNFNLPVHAQGDPAPTPLYRVSVVQGNATAINYGKLTSTAKVDLKGTILSPAAAGVAKVKNHDGRIEIVAKVHDLPSPSSFGAEYLTYVLWGISPEGRVANLGELIPKKGKAKLEVSETLTAFALVVTAEPYFAVTQPSDAVVMENILGAHAPAQVEWVQAKYELLKRGQYTLNLAAAAPPAMDPKTPPDLYQARNAVRIARAAGAEAYAGDAFGKAQAYLQQAEGGQGGTMGRVLSSREAIQKAEDARSIAIQRQDGEFVAMERRQAEEKVAAARQEAARAAEAEQVAQQKVEQAKSETMALRAKLMEQLNSVLETRATARGLIVNMNGVLFKTGKANLTPGAREKLAKIAGVLAAHKGLKIEADGYTDSSGSEAFNQQLSEKRAQITKDYLVHLGVSPEAIIFKGFGEGSPIAPNDTESGRQENRRVELVVTGEGATPQ